MRTNFFGEIPSIVHVTANCFRCADTRICSAFVCVYNVALHIKLSQKQDHALPLMPLFLHRFVTAKKHLQLSWILTSWGGHRIT